MSSLSLSDSPSDLGEQAGTLCRLVLVCSYNGSRFHGFAAQRGQRTVQGAIEAKLSEMCGAPITSGCAGRTDTGVHARAQVVQVDVPPSLVERGERVALAGTELVDLARSLSKQLYPDVVVWRAYVAPEGFDARHSALARRYRYVIETDPRSDPLSRGAAWHVPEELDLAAMRIASDALYGEHDFSAFCRQPKGREPGPLNRRVVRATWRAEGTLLVFEIEANAFCHQMVRSIVGLLVAIGRGKRRASDVAQRLMRPDRSGLPSPAPPQGLCLMAVAYPEHLGGRVE